MYLVLLTRQYHLKSVCLATKALCCFCCAFAADDGDDNDDVDDDDNGDDREDKPFASCLPLTSETMCCIRMYCSW